MAEYFEKYGISVSSEEDAKLMRECVKLIRDIKEDFTVGTLLEEELAQDKKKVLFDIIKENINGWWD